MIRACLSHGLADASDCHRSLRSIPPPLSSSRVFAPQPLRRRSSTTMPRQTVLAVSNRRSFFNPPYVLDHSPTALPRLPDTRLGTSHAAETPRSLRRPLAPIPTQRSGQWDAHPTSLPVLPLSRNLDRQDTAHAHRSSGGAVERYDNHLSDPAACAPLRQISRGQGEDI